MFSDIRKYTELISYNPNYTPTESHSNYFEGEFLFHADYILLLLHVHTYA